MGFKLKCEYKLLKKDCICEKAYHEDKVLKQSFIPAKDMPDVGLDQIKFYFDEYLHEIFDEVKSNNGPEIYKYRFNVDNKYTYIDFYIDNISEEDKQKVIDIVLEYYRSVSQNNFIYFEYPEPENYNIGTKYTSYIVYLYDDDLNYEVINF